MSETDETHADQRLNAVRSSLLAAGIGRAFHTRHLAETMPSLVDAVQGSALLDAREGRGMTFVGSASGYDVAVLVARAFHLQALPVMVVPLRRLVKWIEHETAEYQTVLGTQALFVTGFFDHSLGDCPLAGWQRHDVEELLNDRIDNQQATFPQVSRNLTQGGWWSETLILRLARLNTTVNVDR